MGKPKFKVGDLVRIGGTSGRLTPYTWIKRGRIVKVKAVIRADWLGRRHLGYIIQGRRGRQDVVLASYELRRLEERSPAGRPHKL